jgi:thiamine biosynthesis lipoprotein
VGYRLATWGGSLSSHAVQARVLAMPDLGRTLAREAWRRVLLEPVVMFDEDNVARIAAVHGTHRLYANFFRLALNDSDGFIPREAARLAGLGQVGASRTMLAFAAAVQRAARDSVDLGSADFAAVEGWASLLDRRGTWASGAVPPAGEERARYLGTLAWYGLAPPSAEADRVWVGPRMLVRTGDAEGFVTDDIMTTRAGCPITWRARLHEENTNASAMVSAWFADRPEFPALLAFGGRVAGGLASAGRQVAASVARRGLSPEPGMTRTMTANANGPGAMAVASAPARATVTPAPVGDAAARRSISCLFHALGTDASLTLVAADSNATVPDARSVQAVFDRVDSLMGGRTGSSEVARLNREAAPGPTPVHPEVASVIEVALRVWRDSEHAFDPSLEPLGRAWGFLGGVPRVPPQPDLDAALAHVGAQHVIFDSLARTLRFDLDGVKLDLGGIARGHAVDAAADTLRARGVRDALVDLSGNAVALGAPAHAEDWRVGLRDPRDRSATFARLHLSDGQAVSTSDAHDPFVAADGKSYGRILDPRTGRPADGLVSVTVMARSATIADAWSTALFVLGPADARRLARARTDLSAVLIEPGTDGVDTVWVESDLKDRLEIDPDGRARYRVVYF